MKVDIAGRMTTFGKLRGGSLLQAAHGPLSMKVVAQDGEKTARLLLPYSSGKPGQPRISGQPVDRDLPVFEFADVRFRPSLSHLTIGNDVESEPGDVVLIDDQTRLVAALSPGDTRTLVDVCNRCV